MKQRNSRSTFPNSMGALTIIALTLFVFLLVAVGGWFLITRNTKSAWKQLTASAPLAGDPTKHKPSAAHTGTAIPATNPRAPAQNPSATQQPQAATPSASALAPATSTPATATPINGRRVQASRKGFNNGCKHGELLFTRAEITFTCPSDPGKGVIISPEIVKSVDDDGFELNPKGKYHFDVEGMSRQEAHTLFDQWLTAARAQAASLVP